MPADPLADASAGRRKRGGFGPAGFWRLTRTSAMVLASVLLGTTLGGRVVGAQPDPAAPSGSAPDTPSGTGDWLPRGGAELRVLDTQSAQVTTLMLAVGQSRKVQSLTVTLRACVVHPPDQAADAAARLDVLDAKGAGMPFHGWMFAAEPQMAILENPGYGMLLVGCRQGGG
ncbi:MAG: DUF2155 domain-containing protein [Janthinobacterium lividum]